MPIAAGDRLGPYSIVSPIGEGGMGAVGKARDTRLDRTVAIKVSKAEFSERFEREARAVAALNHPHICQLYDVGHLPAWSADGRWVYFGSDRSGRYEVWKIPAGGGAPVQFTQDGGDAPKRFPGDPWIYWWKDGQIWRTPESGGTPEKVLDYGSESYYAACRDGLVLFGGARMYFVNLRDHKPTVLAELPRPASPRVLRRPTVAISPDQRRVLYTMTALDRGDLILIEGFR